VFLDVVVINNKKPEEFGFVTDKIVSRFTMGEKPSSASLSTISALPPPKERFLI